LRLQVYDVEKFNWFTNRWFHEGMQPLSRTGLVVQLMSNSTDS
jgi:hypothetical protein